MSTPTSTATSFTSTMTDTGASSFSTPPSAGPIPNAPPPTIGAISLAPSEANVQGIREQIFANAMTLYPQLVNKSYQYQVTGVPKPQEIFAIAVASSAVDGKTFKYTAFLLSGHATRRTMAAKGPASPDLTSALQGLLHTTCETLGWYTETLLGELQHAEASDSGFVNFTMVEDGFNFAHMQRHHSDSGN